MSMDASTPSNLSMLPYATTTVQDGSTEPKAGADSGNRSYVLQNVQKVISPSADSCLGQQSSSQSSLTSHTITGQDVGSGGATPSIDFKTTLKTSLEGDRVDFYQYLTKTDGYYFGDGFPHKHYALKPEHRDHLISPRLKQHLKGVQVKRNFVVYCLDSNDVNVKSVSSMMKAAFHSIDSEDEHVNPETIGVALQDANKQDARSMISTENKVIQLAAPEASHEGKILTLYNGSDTRHTLKTKGMMNRPINPAYGLIVQAKKHPETGALEWKYQGKSYIKAQSIYINPLVRDDYPNVFINKVEDNTQSKDGEYFLSREVVMATAQNITGKPLVICQTNTDIRQALESFLASDKEALSLLLHTPTYGHMTMVRFLRKDDKLLVYLHESLAADTVAQLQRKKMIDVLKPQLQRLNIAVFTNGPGMQSDFSNCGVFALNGLEAFENQADVLDPWLWSHFEAAKIKATNADNKQLTSDEITESVLEIPLKELPAILLLLYQGKRSALTEMQMETIVSSEGLTLKDYFNKHSLQACDTATPYNVAATGLRYHYLVQYDNMLKEGSRTLPGKSRYRHDATASGTSTITPESIDKFEPSVEQTSAYEPEKRRSKRSTQVKRKPTSSKAHLDTPVASAAKKSKLSKEADIRSPDIDDESQLLQEFQAVLRGGRGRGRGRGCFNDINLWLTNAHPGKGFLMPNDWTMIRHLKYFMFNSQQLSFTQRSKLKAWFNHIWLDDSNSTTIRLCRAQFYWARRDSRNQFKNMSKEEISELITSTAGWDHDYEARASSGLNLQASKMKSAVAVANKKGAKAGLSGSEGASLQCREENTSDPAMLSTVNPSDKIEITWPSLEERGSKVAPKRMTMPPTTYTRNSPIALEKHRDREKKSRSGIADAFAELQEAVCDQRSPLSKVEIMLRAQSLITGLQSKQQAEDEIISALKKRHSELLACIDKKRKRSEESHSKSADD